METDYEYLLQHVGLMPTTGKWEIQNHGMPKPPGLVIFWTGIHRETAEFPHILELGYSPKTKRYYFIASGCVCSLLIQKKLFL